MKYYPQQSERGAALVVAMVMLFMLTILGVSAMQSANVETQLASNTLAKETTFQSAESATDAALDIPNVLADVVCQTTPNVTVMNNLNRTSNQKTTASAQYGGLAIEAGFSLNNKFSVRRFFIIGESTIEDINTSTTIVTGHSRPSASANGSEC